MVSILTYGHSCPRFDPRHSQKLFEGKMINVSQSHQWRWLEASGQWLENVDRTHLVLDCRKPILQKRLGQILSNKLKEKSKLSPFVRNKKFLNF